MFAREDKCVLMEMLHSCTTEDNKKCILESFQNENGTIRILVATIAFGMGVDCVRQFIVSYIMDHQKPLKHMYRRLDVLEEMGRRAAHSFYIMEFF
jgi:superfamily II DNA helicase RecQ